MGFGKHEDANIRGKGLDFPLIIKDFNLIKWIGANAFRTSHYPYSEEMMDQADAQGIVVIDECPAVGLDRFNSELLKLHLAEITELIQRDKNRPSVVMWSVANEPHSTEASSEDYFRKVVQHTKKLDSIRPVTVALSADFNSDKIGQFLDVIMINRYYGWYSDIGHTEVIVKQLLYDVTSFHKKYLKPVMISEYGADTIAGLHIDPSYVFTEDYQVEFIIQYHKGFDLLYQKGFFVGELIWNFADFLTSQSKSLNSINL
ncbi:beta-glucuronidase-like [Centruroides sculpturatus]|uniref:beta-glucuronidase-like n=1 Tax=Centruroides sculpturatus TaxID=218467 RepID=UPI000C6D14D4|nr:beta-glucuronidase-like [Centruroides sculpturatus]